jgi:hypothetical protein
MESGTKADIPLHRQSVWRLYLLLVLTLGVYLIFWLYGQFKYQCASGRIKGKPLLWVLLSWVPLLDIYIYYFLARNLCREEQRCTRAEPWVFAVTLSVIGNASLFIEPDSWFLAAIVLLTPLPVAWLQYRINQSLAGEPGEALKFTTRQWYALVVGIIFTVILALSMRYDLDVPATGITRQAVGSVVEGPGGFYSVQLPDGNWKKVPSGTIQKDSDLELVDAKNGVKAWVYILEGKDANLPAQVKWRRKEIIDKNEVLLLHEKRILLADYDDAVSSLAEFKLKKPGGTRIHWWIRTLEVGDKLVELLVRTTNEPASESAAVLAKSLKPVMDGEP